MGVILIQSTIGCPSFGAQKIVNEYQLSNTELQNLSKDVGLGVCFDLIITVPWFCPCAIRKY